MRNATAAEAAADKLRNERRDFEGTLSVAITHLTSAILPHNGRKSHSPPLLTQPTAYCARLASLGACRNSGTPSQEAFRESHSHWSSNLCRSCCARPHTHCQTRSRRQRSRIR